MPNSIVYDSPPSTARMLDFRKEQYLAVSPLLHGVSHLANCSKILTRPSFYLMHPLSVLLMIFLFLLFSIFLFCSTLLSFLRQPVGFFFSFPCSFFLLFFLLDSTTTASFATHSIYFLLEPPAQGYHIAGVVENIFIFVPVVCIFEVYSY